MLCCGNQVFFLWRLSSFATVSLSVPILSCHSVCVRCKDQLRRQCCVPSAGHLRDARSVTGADLFVCPFPPLQLTRGVYCPLLQCLHVHVGVQEDPREVEAGKYDLNYIGLDGNIGCMGTH